MQSNDKIQLLHNHEIDKKKWDATVMEAGNSLIYGHSFFLDNMSPGWMALTAIDYSWVLPLTIRKKFGITYLYQPSFMQQAGVFAKENVEIPWKEIIDHLQKQFSFCEMFWNYSTEVGAIIKNISTKAHTNFVLPLADTYETISAKYETDLSKNIKRAEKHTMHFFESKDFAKAITTYKNQYGNRFQHVTETDYKNFEQVCNIASQKQMLTVYEIKDDNGQCLSIALVLKDENRLYNIMNTTTEAGRKMQSNHLLMDNIVRLHAQSHFILDFEGSDLPGVKSFYENFGATNQPYHFIKYNKLPFLLKLFKH